MSDSGPGIADLAAILDEPMAKPPRLDIFERLLARVGH
jgi:hypothetical protein